MGVNSGYGCLCPREMPKASKNLLRTEVTGHSELKAWAGAGDGVLFYDADGSGDISERREYVFTEWDPTATSDLEALRSVFDTNGDGRLTNADTTWSQFRVARTEPDGTLSYHTLDALGITEIDPMGDATNIELPDGSVITGRATFTMNGQTRTVGEMVMAQNHPTHHDG